MKSKKIISGITVMALLAVNSMTVLASEYDIYI